MLEGDGDGLIVVRVHRGVADRQVVIDLCFIALAIKVERPIHQNLELGYVGD